MIQKERPPVKAVSGLDTSILGARARIPYDQWAESTGLPIYGGHVVHDPMSLDLAPWPLFGMNTAFVQLEGMPTVCEGRVSELPPGASSAELKQAVSEVVYVLDGEGTATVWSGDGPRQSISWQRSSLFLLPRNVTFQLSNSGSRPARLLSYNYRPMAMTSLPDVNLHFNGPWEEPQLLYGSAGEFYAAPTMVTEAPLDGSGDTSVAWHGNFFADIGSWDRLEPDHESGPDGRVARITFPGAGMTCHLSVVGPQRYTKARKHGPGRVVVLARGEGMGAIMTPQGWENSEFHLSERRAYEGRTPVASERRIVSPMREGSFFAVPDNWYHQHFNTGTGEARFLVLHPLPQFGGNPYSHRLEYTDEDPWVRELFEGALAERGLESQMPRHRDGEPSQDRERANVGG